MMTIPTLTQTKFTWRFLALNRHDKKPNLAVCPLRLRPNAKHAASFAPHFILSLPHVCQCRRCAVFNLQTLTAKARELRGNVVKGGEHSG